MTILSDISERVRNDRRAIITLDAGGTNLVFSAIRGNQEVVSPITLPSHAEYLEKCLQNIIEGFEKVMRQLEEKPVAISFAFPGPAFYHLGIINDLRNFPAFRGGVALGPMLEDHFQMPVFINNDGDLFAYGEALSGFLPRVNARLKESGSLKEYRNLIGLTLGTGFGCGIVLDNRMLTGDNSCGAEINTSLNPININWNAEVSVSSKAIRRDYAEHADIPLLETLMPKAIYEIARGSREGNKDAALKAFQKFGESLGGSISNVLALIDGLVVLGGGLTAAWDLFAPSMFDTMNGNFPDIGGSALPRTTCHVYNLEENSSFSEFSKKRSREISVPGSDRTIIYDDFSRTGVGVSELGASRAISLGAYAVAILSSG